MIGVCFEVVASVSNSEYLGLIFLRQITAAMAILVLSLIPYRGFHGGHVGGLKQ